MLHTFQGTLYHFVKKSKKSSQPSNLTKSHTNKHPQTIRKPHTTHLTKSHTNNHPQTIRKPHTTHKLHTNYTQTNIRKPSVTRKPHKITHKQSPANHPQTTHHTQITPKQTSVNHTPHTNYTQTIRKPHTNHAQKNTPEDPYLPGHSAPFCEKIKNQKKSSRPAKQAKKRPRKIRTFQGHSILIQYILRNNPATDQSSNTVCILLISTPICCRNPTH